MKISFSILWFDDESDYFDSLDLGRLKDVITSWGFEPNIKLVTSSGEFMKFSPFQEFDLIVVDYNLEEYGHGQEFIESIRNHDVYTEVIFYSASSSATMWSAIKDKKLEGVFVAGKQNQAVVTKIEKVAKQSVRKILDLDNMRGLVMAEVGDIDLLLDEAVLIGFRSLGDEERKAVYSRFCRGYGKQIKSNQKSLDALKANENIINLMGMCDSYKRWCLLVSVAKRHRSLDHENISGYDKDVLFLRNILAHGKPSKEEDGSYKFSHNGKEFVYSEHTSIDLRSKIIEYKRKFEKVINDIKA